MLRYPHPMSRRMRPLSLARVWTRVWTRVLTITVAVTLASIMAVPAPALAASRADHTVKYGAHPLQALDIYLPPAGQNTARNAPVMVMVHGGAWVIGDKAHRGVWYEKQQYWGARGYIFISVNYRMIPLADPLEQARDVARALAYIQENIAGLGGDAGRVVVMGHSAGAHLVARLAANPEWAASFRAQQWRGTVAIDSAAYDVEKIMTTSPSRLYRRAFGRDPALWRASSPIANLTTGTAPFLLPCSVQRANACPAARKFSAALAGQGGHGQVVAVDKSHNEMNADLGRPGAYTQAIDAFLASIGLP